MSNVGDTVNAQSKLSRAITLAQWVIVACMTLYLCVRTLPQAWKTLDTDFPNYYLTALLSQEGFDATRVYEWRWIQRQKDHSEVSQPLVGLVPITPFSTLMVRPLTRVAPLAAKRWWILFNLCLLAGACVLIHSLTELEWRQIGVVAALNISLHRNLAYGQYYVLLLFIMVLACWCYRRGRRVEAGVLIGFSAGLKIFPGLYLLYFLRKRDVKALAGGIGGVGVAAVVSVFAFGWELNRIYLSQVLPWAFRGEGLNPYNVSSSSIASLLHRLFIYEPQWNRHPVGHLPWIFAIVHPLLQVLIVGAALLLVSPGEDGPLRVETEWAAMLVALLTISTMPASYVFTLMIFPVCVFWRGLEVEGRWKKVLVLFVAYLIVGVPVWNSLQGVGWRALLGFPRLYALIGICVLSYCLLWQGKVKRNWVSRDEVIWALALICALTFGIVSGIRHQSGVYADYAFRIPMKSDALMASVPVQGASGTSFIAMLRGGYRVGLEREGAAKFSDSALDQLGVTVTGNERWIEEVGRQSNVIDEVSGHLEVSNAEYPIMTSDATKMAFLREDRGRSQLWIHQMGDGKIEDRPLTPRGTNIYDMAFLTGDELIFAADKGSEGAGLYGVDLKGNIGPLIVAGGRYPAVSPDGKWLAYSRLDGGSWNLWIKKIGSEREMRITNADCNNIEPNWDHDSKTLIYASDCGRALWLTALSRRRVLP